MLVLGWRGARWWRRGTALLSVPLCLLCAALILNVWVGYFPTLQTPCNQAASRSGARPDRPGHPKRHGGQESPAAARHRRAGGDSRGRVTLQAPGRTCVLPPEWFESSPPPPQPTVMMIGGQFNTPADWTRAGNAIQTIDDFAAHHNGSAPVLVFVDSGGTFNNDTECVNGPRGNAADRVTKDIVPYMVSTFGVSAAPSNFGIVGWSMGGTCAVDVTVMHPELFSAFVDIAGDYFPNAGNKAQAAGPRLGGWCDSGAAQSTARYRHD